MAIFVRSLPVVERAIVRSRRWHYATARRRADLLLGELYEHTQISTRDDLFRFDRLAPVWTFRWFRSFHIGALLQALTTLATGVGVAFFILFPLGNVDGRWRHGFDFIKPAFDSLRKWEKDGDIWNRYREDPVAISVLAVVILTAIALAVIYTRAQDRARKTTIEPPKITDTQPSQHVDYFADYTKCWPVVVLLMTALECSKLRERLAREEQSGGIANVSLTDAERVIWNLHRFRYGLRELRRHRKQALKEHSALVVGALRALEIKQDTDAVQSLDELTAALLKIAERYCEGRLGELLSPEEIGDAKPAMPREGIRFALTTTAILLVMAAASVLGLPDAALGALLPVAVIVLAGLFYRGRLPGPAQMTDLIIPR
ncbi:hypothetical protein [Streptomyces sp. NPDC005244]|uniref:hypothetical protein n=1 Tax=Streptomyces sp. NPDC005244 TaxID=3364708 RepID=UPI0036B14C19